MKERRKNFVVAMVQPDVLTDILRMSGLEEKSVKIDPRLAVLGDGVLAILDQQLDDAEKIKRLFGVIRLAKDIGKGEVVECSFELRNIVDVMRVIVDSVEGEE